MEPGLSRLPEPPEPWDGFPGVVPVAVAVAVAAMGSVSVTVVAVGPQWSHTVTLVVQPGGGGWAWVTGPLGGTVEAVVAGTVPGQ